MRNISIGNKTFSTTKELGKGSFGKVYEITFEGKQSAIKVIKNPAIEGVKSLKELDIMSRLEHPHLMSAKIIISDCCLENSSKVGIVMDLAERDMHKAMYDKTFLLSSRLKILKQVTEGLQFLHEENYLHLDIKPLNILLFKNNSYGKLSDFGLSLRTEEGAKGIFKDFPIEIITVTHRSINVLQGNKRYTAADDVWALGITFFEVISGGYSFFSELKKGEYTSKNVLNIIKRKLNPKDIEETLSKYFWKLNRKTKIKAINLVRRMLDFNPESRPKINEILASPLLRKYPVYSQGKIKNLPILAPVECNEMIYDGFDVLVRLCNRILVKTETFFFAADIYQRILAYRQKNINIWRTDYNNTVYQATLALYVAIKMIESFFADTKQITALAGDLFPSDYLLTGESFIVNTFQGKIYSNNLFTNSSTYSKLLEGFDLSRNCHIYHLLNFKKWGNVKSVNKSDYSKWKLFSAFLKETIYFDYLTDLSLSYLPEIYEKDFTNQELLKLI